MDVSLFIQSIHESLETIQRSQGNTESDIKGISQDMAELKQNNIQLCTRVDVIEKYIDAQKVGYKTAMLLTGALSALAGAIAGIVMFTWTLLQYGGMLKGGGGGTP